MRGRYTLGAREYVDGETRSTEEKPHLGWQGSSLLLTKEKAPLELDGDEVDVETRAPDDVVVTREDRSLF